MNVPAILLVSAFCLLVFDAVIRLSHAGIDGEYIGRPKKDVMAIVKQVTRSDKKTETIPQLVQGSATLLKFKPEQKTSNFLMTARHVICDPNNAPTIGQIPQETEPTLDYYDDVAIIHDKDDYEYHKGKDIDAPFRLTIERVYCFPRQPGLMIPHRDVAIIIIKEQLSTEQYEASLFLRSYDVSQLYDCEMYGWGHEGVEGSTDKNGKLKITNTMLPYAIKKYRLKINPNMMVRYNGQDILCTKYRASLDEDYMFCSECIGPQGQKCIPAGGDSGAGITCQHKKMKDRVYIGTHCEGASDEDIYNKVAKGASIAINGTSRTVNDWAWKIMQCEQPPYALKSCPYKAAVVNQRRTENQG